MTVPKYRECEDHFHDIFAKFSSRAGTHYCENKKACMALALGMTGNRVSMTVGESRTSPNWCPKRERKEV